MNLIIILSVCRDLILRPTVIILFLVLIISFCIAFTFLLSLPVKEFRSPYFKDKNFKRVKYSGTRIWNVIASNLKLQYSLKANSTKSTKQLKSVDIKVPSFVHISNSFVRWTERRQQIIVSRRFSVNHCFRFFLNSVFFFRWIYKYNTPKIVDFELFDITRDMELLVRAKTLPRSSSSVGWLETTSFSASLAFFISRFLSNFSCGLCLFDTALEFFGAIWDYRRSWEFSRFALNRRLMIAAEIRVSRRGGEISKRTTELEETS